MEKLYQKQIFWWDFMSRNYLILGASSDIGIELVKEITKRENQTTIWAHYFSSDKCLRGIKQINENKIIPIRADFSKTDDIMNLFLNIQESNKIPTSIVHLSAPKLSYQKFKDINWYDCVQDVQIQVGAVFKILQLFLPSIIKTEYRAKIVFMLSENTIHQPAKFSTKYTMSKYMLLGLMKSLAVEYAGKNVDINALSPSMIDTKFLRDIDRRMLEISGATDNILNPCDVLPWLWKLLSEYSDGINGQNIMFSGGEVLIE